MIQIAVIQSGSLSSNSNTFLINVNEQKKNSRNTIFRAPKSLQEKVLVLLSCLLLIISTVFLISLWIMSSRWKTTLSQLKSIYVEEDDICDTDACKETAKGLLSNLDPSTDPCVDFYQYACGGWMEKHPIPKGRQAYMVHEDRQKEMTLSITDLILNESNETTTSKSVENARRLYKACMNKDSRNEIGMKQLQDLVKQHGGWPMIGDNEWTEDGYDWQEKAAKANRNLFTDIFVDISFMNNLVDNRYYIMELQSGFFPFANGRDHDFLNETYREETCDDIMDIARLMGSTLDDDTLREQAEEIVELDYLFFNASMESVDEQESLAKAVGELNSEVNGETFSYIGFLNHHLQSDTPIKNDTVLYVYQPEYFLRLPSIMASVKKRTIANYIAFNIVYFFAEYSSDEIRNLTYGNKSITQKSEARLCQRITKSFMSLAVGRMYIDRYFPPLTRMHVKKMVEMIRLAYSSTIDQNTWMDENTLLYALVKLQSIQNMVGYEDWLLDDVALDAFYGKLGDVQEDNFFDAVVTLCTILNDVKYSRWNKTGVRNETDLMANDPVVVNAYYIPSTNFISLPAGMFGYPYYKYGRIDSINYGAIGTVIGHEISHAFDTTGRNFDHLGNLREWWTNGTKVKFLEKAACFAHQYNNYKDLLSPVTVDGTLTLGENIADNGGVRNAFKAFRLHLALSGEGLNYRKRLPGLSASPEQLFFLGYASIWCANMTHKYAMGFKENDNHSPNKIRVNVPLANFKEFAKAYHCKPGSPMNPTEKCVLW
ncbi:Neprilysin-1 like protein [Argiope bruennichi]|uniref:Neprilysin-1 like protein n=1 Tax=Argiope bruennichi TaxID=94029 RepID=A0A8T0EDN0_ARGBR|nr:Neprilysin-1 like protein [Argiope bruennichi]